MSKPLFSYLEEFEFLTEKVKSDTKRVYKYEKNNNGVIEIARIEVSNNSDERIKWGFRIEMDEENCDFPHEIVETPEWFQVLYRSAVEDFEKKKRIKALFIEKEE